MSAAEIKARIEYLKLMEQRQLAVLRKLWLSFRGPFE
jgi:hypothetical protein